MIYKPAEPQLWTGRNDGESPDLQRWHQIIEFVNLDEKVPVLQFHHVFLGFCCDEGVKRNQGRVGAKDAPQAIRRILASLPNHLPSMMKIADAGDIICDNEDLESAQKELSVRVAQIIEMGGMPVVLGGGHELTYGNYNGLKEKSTSKNIGIINLDAHLDIRKPKDQIGNSGTGFYQIIEDAKVEGIPFHYLAIGIQDISNTQALFNYADENGVEIVKGYDIHPWNLEAIKDQLKNFASKVDHIYITIDMDFFASSFAPGVSSPSFNGVIPDSTFIRLFESIIDLPNIWIIDFAEVNPLFDIDNRTTKLAADLIFRLVNRM